MVKRMASVNVELGLTLKLNSGGGYNYFRPQIGIHDIDIDGDVQDQIKRALEVAHEAWEKLEEDMVDIVTKSDAFDSETLLVELGRRMSDMEKQLATVAGGPAKEW